MLTKIERNNFEKAVKDCNNEILKCEGEIAELKQCLGYMELNYYDGKIEENISKFLKFHLKNVDELIIQRKSEKGAYKSALEEN